MEAHRITNSADARTFITAGNAYLTLRSAKTGTRYTYRVSAHKHQAGLFFVSTLYGSDNTGDYAYLGIIRDNQFSLTSKSKFTFESPQFKAFAWAWGQLWRSDNVPDTLEIWHEGRCGKCGRLLTVPESIANGIGPECAKKIAFRAEAA
jgi:hypothetical protein